jgi:sialate O-acetylesterase
MRTGLLGTLLATLLTTILPAPNQARADVQLPPHFSSGMVLQQKTQARIFGFARPGERVVVTGSWKLVDPASGAEVEPSGESVATDTGFWGVTIPTPDAAAVRGPVSVTIQGANTIVLKDVLIGEVWLASGQSNMEWPISAAAEPDRALGEAATANVRFFQVENALSLHRRAEAVGRWIPAQAGGAPVAGWSAVAFNFARELSTRLGVPVGIIQADWGGTPAEAWMSPQALAAFPQFTADLKQHETLRDPTARMSLMGDLEARWWSELDGLKGGAGPDWMKPEFNDASWSEVRLPANFTGDLARFDGIVYHRLTIDLPPEAAGKEGTLELGPVDDRDEAWVNGVLVGATRADNQWSVARVYAIPAGVLKAGKNVVAVRVYDTAGLGGFGGKPEQMRLAWDKTLGTAKAVGLAGPWRQKAGPAKADLPEIGRAPNIGPGSPSVLFNAMIAPLAPTSLAGVIWYQGESNVGAADQYTALFQGLIADWRDQFRRSDLPFGFVQIAPFEYTRFMPITMRSRAPDLTARLREAQHAASRIRRAGMVVTLDVGDPADIHPRDKRTVGQRLANWALAEVYAVADAPARSPSFSDVGFDGPSVTLHAVDTGGGLVPAPGVPSDRVPGFAVCGDDKRFLPATGRIDGDTVIVTAPGVTKALAVRYAWDQAPAATIMGKNGLPVAPFRSDKWEWGTYSTALPDVREFRTKEPGFVDLFNGKDLAGWSNINTAPSTWSVKPAASGAGDEPVIACTGVPTGLLRTDAMYENFILELEWRHLEPGGNAGLFVWSDALTARGQPFTRSLEVQVMDGAEGDWYTSDGDIFPIHGATMTPENPRGNGNRAFPTERRMRTSPEWNHYRVECSSGDIALAVNGKVVTRGKAASPRKGYICLESEGSPVEFRAIRIKELPPSGAITPEQTARAAEGFVPLYNGVDFAGWKFTDNHKGHWKADDWTITFDGQGPEASDLWTERSYKDFVLVCDWRWTTPGVPTPRPVILPDGSIKKTADGKDEMVTVTDAGDSGIYLRGSSKSQVNMWCWPIGSGEVYGYRTDAAMPPEVRAGVTPAQVADAPIGQWNRFVITMKGELLTVELNGKTVLKDARLPGVAAEGPIALQHHGSPIQFANIYIKELK